MASAVIVERNVIAIQGHVPFHKGDASHFVGTQGV